MVKETKKRWPRKEILVHTLHPFLATSLAGVLGVFWHWQVGINPQQGSPFGGCLQSSQGTMKPQSSTLISYSFWHISFILHSHRQAHCWVSKAENVDTEKAERLELWLFLPCPEDHGWVPKIIAYSEQCQIPDLQKRRFSFGTRDQAWSLKSFHVAECY